MASIRSIMTKNVRTIPRNAYVNEVAGIFDTEGIGAAPLVNLVGDTVGVITKSDISHFEFVGGDPYSGKAWEISSPRVTTVDVSSSVEDAARAMLEHHIHHLLVADNGTIVGILSSLDFVKLVADADG
ncbi:MAG: CBS domain-containing protein [Deltaproteobacteria bacterium]|nr:CBS domain-containing protein [Deltaproteobacteria bacterium]MBW2723407.1 CBS domain-containing protein [Deltaproteobacteria bacterium]